MLSSASNTNLSDLLGSQRATKPVATTEQNLPNHSIDDYLSFRARGTSDLPTVDASTVDPTVKIAYLHREIQLLRNDLNFEQFLKAQHLSHIGQLRQKQIREARVEAETQNLINSNRQLRAKLEEAKRVTSQIRKETEKSKSHSRKWETDLSNKLRTLKEEQKKWVTEKGELTQDLDTSRSDCTLLRQLVVKAERKELIARQRLMTLEVQLEELTHLRAENERLNGSLIQYEVEERTSSKAKASEDRAIQEAALFRDRLKAKTRELLLAKEAFERELFIARNERDDEEILAKQRETAALYDSMLATARNRTAEVQKAMHRLQLKYNNMLQENMLLRGEVVYDDDFEVPLQESPQRVTNSRLSVRRSKAPSGDWDPSRLASTAETGSAGGSAGSSRTPVSPTGLGGTGHFAGTEPFVGMIDRRPSSKEKDEAKIKPQSEVRFYGRGGVQNIGKKDKPKDDGKDGKKEKKGIGIRGIRGFS
jgi:solute carrier family 25 protein 16